MSTVHTVHQANGGHWFLAPVSAHMPTNTVQHGRFQDAWPKGWTRVCHRGIDLRVSHMRPRGVPDYQICGLILPAYDADPRIVEIIALADVVAIGWEDMQGTARLVAQVSTSEIYGCIGGRTRWIHTYHMQMFMAAATPSAQTIPEGLQHAIPQRTVRGAYRGWRKWMFRMEGIAEPHIIPVLRSIVYSSAHQWHEGWNVARGGKGFYACSTVDETLQQDGTRFDYERGACVLGSVLHAGRIIVGTRGNRAQWCMPECVVLTGDMQTDGSVLLPIAERYGMRVCTLDEARAMPTGLVPYEGEPPPEYRKADG